MRLILSVFSGLRRSASAQEGQGKEQTQDLFHGDFSLSFYLIRLTASRTREGGSGGTAVCSNRL